MEKKMKLKKLVEQFMEEQEIDEQAFLESVSNYSSYGKEIYREHDIIETAKKLSEIARIAGIHAVRETEDSFDKITVNRNMKELKSYSEQFLKVAAEANGLQQRTESLFEDMGRVLGRYYEIKESNVNESATLDEAKLKFDEKKVMKLIEDDKFLTYIVKKDFRGKVDKTKLEQIFFMYIAGDKAMEKKYLKIK
tara:strand:- start:48 stop:629 length:582 start_codon:yes stop_codon:yes gene_type:complete